MSDKTAELETDQPDDAPAKAKDKSKPDVPPDRLSINPMSNHFDEEKLKRGIGIRFKGKVRTNVQEYSIPDGWVKMLAGKSTDRFGNPLTIKSTGPVEAWYEDLGDDPPVNRKA